MAFPFQRSNVDNGLAKSHVFLLITNELVLLFNSTITNYIYMYCLNDFISKLNKNTVKDLQL